MHLSILAPKFAVCKLEDLTNVNINDEFCFIGKTDQEISLVCEAISVPVNCLAVEHGWKGFRVEGQLDFSLIGILSKLSTLLAEAEISIFAISTYDTDYVLVKEDKLERAIDVLNNAGYSIQH